MWLSDSYILVKGTLRVVGQWPNDTAMEADRNEKVICKIVHHLRIAQLK